MRKLSFRRNAIIVKRIAPIALPLALLFSAAALASCEDQSGSALKSQLLDKAAELTELYSQTSDAFTRFDSITVPANSTMQFNYTLLYATSDMLTEDLIAMWSADAYPALLEGIHGSEDLKFFSDRYVKLVYFYATIDGAEFATLTFTRKGINTYEASSQKPFVPPSASDPPPDEDVDRLLSFIATELDAGCPMELDGTTRIDSVTTPASKTLQHNYTLTGDFVSANILRAQLVYSIEHDRSAKWMTMKNCGVTFVYSYSDEDGQPQFTLTIAPDDYGA